MTDVLNRRRFLQTSLAAAGLTAVGTARWHPAAAQTPLPMQAAWINDAEFMGYFIALDKGWYKEEGLALEYLPGGPDVIPESALLSGRAPLALTTPETTIKAIAEQGAPFKIIGAQYQKNPIGVVSLADNPILKPEDLIGKTLAAPPVNTLTVEAMLTMNGIDKGAVRIVPYAYDPTPLINGEIDASIDFTTNVPYAIEQAGKKAVSFLLYDFGFTIYNDTVVVTEQALAERRDDLIGWLRASRRGWDENFKDPDAYPPQFETSWFEGTGRTIANEIYFNNAQQPLMAHPDGIFALSEEGIEQNIAALSAIGIKASREMFDTTLLQEV